MGDRVAEGFQLADRGLQLRRAGQHPVLEPGVQGANLVFAALSEGDVFADDHDGGNRAAFVHQRDLSGMQIDGPLLGMDARLGRDVRHGPRSDHGQVVGQEGIRLFPGPEVVGVLADNGAGRDAENQFGRPVPKDHPELVGGVLDEEGVRGMLHDAGEELLGLAQGFFGLFAVADVDDGAHNAGGHTTLVACHHLAPPLDPEHRAVPGDDPVLGDRCMALPLQALLMHGEHPFAVPGEDDAAEKGAVKRGVVRGVADQLAVARAQVHLVTYHVPVPEPLSRQVQDQFTALVIHGTPSQGGRAPTDPPLGPAPFRVVPKVPDSFVKF